MNVNDVFAGRFLKVEMLKGRTVTLTIANAELAKFDEGNKIAIGFQETEKELALNKTNAYAVAMMYGEETSGWMGKRIEIFPDTTMYAGKMTPCIRVRAPQGQPAAQVQQPGHSPQQFSAGFQQPQTAPGFQQAQSYGGNPNLPPTNGGDAFRSLGDDEFPPAGSL